MPANVGNQTVTILYRSLASSSVVNKRFQDIRQTGIYKGGYLSKVDDSHAKLSPLVCEISDGTYQVRVETASEVSSIAVGTATPYVILRWKYTGNVTDYMEVLAVATPSTNDLVVGKCTFDGGGNLTGFDYQDSDYPRTTPNIHDLFLKVESTDETELRVRIRAGRIQTNSGVVDIPDQKSDLFTPPASNSRVDLIYVTDAGVIAIDNSGTPAAEPSPPSYEGRLVLAEITLDAGDTDITSDKIKDVRSFINPSNPAGDGSYITEDASNKLTLVNYSVDKTKVSRYLPGQILPGWYVKYHASNNKTKPGDFTYGDPSGRFISLGQIICHEGHNVGSYLFEMKVYNASGGVKSITQKLRYLDDNIYFYFNDSGTAFKSVTGTGGKNEDITWNLSPGENTLQIVHNNTGSDQSHFTLLGDIINDTDVYFVGPAS